MKLTSENVYAVFSDCLWEDDVVNSMSEEEMIAKSVVTKGIVTNVGFDPAKIEKNKAKIAEFLAELPDEFKQGWSFLNACTRKDGEQWGEHRSMEQLMLLGMAAGLVKECAPREMWPLLPGGMPYYEVV